MYLSVSKHDTLKDEEPEADAEVEAEDKPAPKAGTIFSKVKEA